MASDFVEVKVSVLLFYNNTLILVYLCKGGSMEPFELPWIHPCIVVQS